MRSYETIFIVQPDLNDEDIKVLSEKVQDTIASLGGTCHRLEDWGTRKLAYPVMKFPRGRYFYLTFDGEPSLVSELERRFRLDDKVIRYQTVKLEKGIPAPVAAVEEVPVVEATAETAAETKATETAE